MRAVLALALLFAPVCASAQSGDFRVRPLNGAVTRFAEATPRAVRVVNIWAPWCGPCVAELPALQALSDSLKADGIAVVTVTGDRVASVQRFLERTAVSLPVLLEHDAIPDAWGVDRLPTTVLLDAEGRVLHRYAGVRDWSGGPMLADVRARAGRAP